uniref:Deoxyuridine 5'-triphosphate nucleotidohydrolase n=1 Tax=Meloidogyne hapla TaxID=6305 RepID=A0A1I8BA63_MELHA
MCSLEAVLAANPPRSPPEEEHQLSYKKIKKEALAPVFGSKNAAGADLHSAEDCVVPAKGKYLVSTGIQIALPDGYYGRIAPRSGLASKNFIDVGAGVIDTDYRGEIKVLLFNFSDVDFKFTPSSMTDSAIQTDNLLGGAPPIVGGVPPIVVRTKPTWLQTDFNKNVIDSISNDVTFRNKSMLWDALIVGFALFVSLGGFLYFMFEKLEKGVDDKLQAQTQAIQAVGKSVDDKIQAVGKSVDDKIQAAGKSVDDKIQALSQSFYSLSSELHSYMRWMIGYISQGVLFFNLLCFVPSLYPLFGR